MKTIPVPPLVDLGLHAFDQAPRVRRITYPSWRLINAPSPLEASCSEIVHREPELPQPIVVELDDVSGDIPAFLRRRSNH